MNWGGAQLSPPQYGMCIFKNNFRYFFLAVLGLPCCAGFSLTVASGGQSLAAVRRFLIVVASLVVEHGL